MSKNQITLSRNLIVFSLASLRIAFSLNASRVLMGNGLMLAMLFGELFLLGYTVLVAVAIAAYIVC